MRICIAFLVLLSPLAFALDDARTNLADWCASQLTDSTFSPRQRAAIAEAAADGYSIRRLTGQINGRLRTVTVIGESLLKSESAAVAGARMLRTFDVVAHGRNQFYDRSWFPKIFRNYVNRRVAAERAANPSDHFGSVTEMRDQDEAVRAFEDEVVAKFVPLVADPRVTRADVRQALAHIKSTGSLVAFDREDVLTRIFAKQVTRKAQDVIELDQDYRPTTKHNLAMVFVIASTKLRWLAGRVPQIISGIGVLSGVTWMAATNGHDGGLFTLGAATAWIVQNAIDFGYRSMTPEFGGQVPLSLYLTDALVDLLAKTDPRDEVVLVVSELKARRIQMYLRQREFWNEVDLPYLENGRPVQFTR